MAILKNIAHTIKKVTDDTSQTFARTPRNFALKDWKNALVETKNAIGSKSIPILSAGVAYFLTFAVFPGIAALVGILSFAITPEELTSASRALQSFLPSDIAFLITTQLEAALDDPSSSIMIIIFGLLVALFSLSGAMGNVIKAVNAIYDVEESRKFILARLTGAVFILSAGIVTVLTVGLLVLNETLLMSWGIPAWLAWIILIVRWAVIAILVTVGLSAFYRYAPNRSNPHWQWVTWGSLIATVVWLIGTTLFFLYARFLASYTESYSVFAGIIVLMIWLNITSFAVLLGATINYHLENQTRARTTD